MPKTPKPKTKKITPAKTLRNELIVQCRIILLISQLRYPKLPSYTFPVYMLLKYIKLVKSKRTFRLKSVPQTLLIDVSRNNPLIDVNNCVVANEGYFKAILNCSEYVKLRHGAKERIVQVIPGKLSENDILTSDTLSYNLKQRGLPEQLEVAEIDLTNIKIADEIDLSLIVTQQNTGHAVTDLLLKNYFRNPKLLYKNDVISVSVRDYAPDYFYTNAKCNETEFLYFKCNGIVYGSTVDCTGGYFCVIGATTLKQSGDTQSYLPTQSAFVKDKYEVGGRYEDALVDLCPPGLMKYLERLEKGIRPFLSKRKMKLNPVFLLQGPKGSGKDLLLNALSKKFGLKLCRLTNNDLCAQAYAQNEIKMRNAFFRCKLCAPCIVAINNFENLCKNNEGHHDPRIINSFKTELETLLANNEHPIVLVCVSNLKELPNELGRMFLEAVNIDAPDQNERAQLLGWAVSKQGLNEDTAIDEIAGKTHGFVYEDLEALLYYAKKNAVFNSRPPERLGLNDFEAALDVMQSNYTESLGAPKVPKVEWSDVGGLDDVKHEIIRTINLPLKHPELLKTGLKRSGILLYGPPGTGKTLIAKAVATECGLCFLSVKGPELLNMYVGQSEQNVREVFEKARQAAPCIIFFDELDSLAPNRGISGDSGGVMDRVVSQMLSEMDGLNQNTTLFVIGATNRPDLIDPALLRPGRFDKLLYVGPCTDQHSKISVLKALTRNFNLSEKLSIERVVKACPENITGADFYGICSSAWMSAASRLIRKIEKGKADKDEPVSHSNVLVTFKDFEEAVTSAKPSISPADLLYFDRLKKELSAKK